ncbi:MAG: hypothetical protein P4L53_00625 [Candidatus Obscuribacterales bacterium]|nr:hypothetical protein [Candidatus Obscuribacterales bacterium]
MKKLLILPFLFVLVMQTSTTMPASAHSYGWYQRHQARAFNCGGWGYGRPWNRGCAYGGYPGYGYSSGLFGGVHRFFNGYYR